MTETLTSVPSVSIEVLREQILSALADKSADSRPYVIQAEGLALRAFLIQDDVALDRVNTMMFEISAEQEDESDLRIVELRCMVRSMDLMAKMLAKHIGLVRMSKDSNVKTILQHILSSSANRSTYGIIEATGLGQAIVFQLLSDLFHHDLLVRKQYQNGEHCVSFYTLNVNGRAFLKSMNDSSLIR